MERKLFVPPFENHIENFIESEINILCNLKQSLKELTLKDLKNKKKLQVIIKDIKLKIKEFNRQKDENWELLHFNADFSKHTRLWSQTNRLFSTKIKTKKIKSLYDEIEKCLLIKTSHKQARCLIELAKKNHKSNLIQFKLNFLQEARGYKIRQLKKELALLNLSIQSEKKLRLALNQLLHLNKNNLKTRFECVSWHKKVTEAEQMFIKECKKINIEKKHYLKIKNLATDLSIITKREIDEYYAKPQAFNKIDKLRKLLKILSLIIGFIFSLTAFILLFTPAAPLAPFLGLVGLAGFYPLLDTLIEVTKNIIFYKRSPLINQAAEIIIGAIVVLLLSALFPITNLILPAISTIAGTIGAKICNFIAKGFIAINLFGTKIGGTLANAGILILETQQEISSLFSFLTAKIKSSMHFKINKPVVNPNRLIESNKKEQTPKEITKINFFRSCKNFLLLFIFKNNSEPRQNEQIFTNNNQRKEKVTVDKNFNAYNSKGIEQIKPTQNTIEQHIPKEEAGKFSADRRDISWSPSFFKFEEPVDIEAEIIAHSSNEDITKDSALNSENFSEGIQTLKGKEKLADDPDNSLGYTHLSK